MLIPHEKRRPRLGGRIGGGDGREKMEVERHGCGMFNKWKKSPASSCHSSLSRALAREFQARDKRRRKFMWAGVRLYKLAARGRNARGRAACFTASAFRRDTQRLMNCSRCASATYDGVLIAFTPCWPIQESIDRWFLLLFFFLFFFNPQERVAIDCYFKGKSKSRVTLARHSRSESDRIFR